MKTTSICAGTYTFDMALIEASAYLKTHPSERVMLVCFDQALPDYYQKELTENSIDYSVALLLENDEGADCAVTKNDETLNSWPRALATLQTLLSQNSERLAFSKDENRWNVCEAQN